MTSSYGWFSNSTTTVWRGRGTAGPLTPSLVAPGLGRCTPIPFGVLQPAIALPASTSQTSQLFPLMGQSGRTAGLSAWRGAAKQAYGQLTRPLSSTFPANRLALACLGELAP